MSAGRVHWRRPSQTTSLRGRRIAYSADFDVYPVDPRVTAVVTDAVSVFEQAGAYVNEVTLGIDRDQRELSDLWCRLIAPANLHAFDTLEQQGLDISGDHPDDLPPEYRHWLDVGSRMSALDVMRDQVVRTEIYDAIQQVFTSYDLLVTPTLACLAVDNADDIRQRPGENGETSSLRGEVPTR